MKKITKILIIVSIFTLFSINILAANNPQHAIKLINQDENSVGTLSAPKESATGDVTSLWNYSFTNVGSTDPLVAISGNGESILAINASTANLFKRSSNSTQWVFNDPPQNLEDFAISNDGKYIVICDLRQVFLLNNTPSASKTAMWVYPTVRPGSDQYFTVDISNDGQYIVVGNRTALSEGIQLFDNIYSSSKQPLWSHSTGGPQDIAISGNGERIVKGDNVGQVIIYNSADPTDEKLNYVTPALVSEVAISYDGKYAVARNSNNEAYLFNSTNPGGKPMWKFSTSFSISCVDISSNGQNIVVGNHRDANPNYYGGLYYFNNSYQSNNKTAEWKWGVVSASNDYMLWDVELSGLGEYVALGTSYCSFYLFNSSKANSKTYTWKNPATYVFSVGMSFLGDYLVFGSETEKMIYLYHHDVPLSSIISYLLGDDDDDDDDEPAIPYGNYYLGFAGVAIVALIVIMKRKTLLKRKI